MIIESPDNQTQLSQSRVVIEAVRRISQRLLETWQQSDPVSALEHTLADILRQVDEEVIGHQEVSAMVYVYDEDEGFSNGEARGPLREYMEQYPPRKGGTGEYTVQTRQPLFVADVSVMPPGVPPLSKLALEQGVKAFANLPLLIGQEGQETLVGILLINLQEKFEFDEERQAILRLFADQAAIALQNARVHRQQLREQEALRLISESALSGQPDEVGQIITREAVELTKSTYATFWSADLKRSQLELRGVYARDVEWQPPQTTLPIDEHSINGYVARIQEAYYAPRLDTDPHYVRWHDRIKAALCVPLLAREELIGTLYVASEKENGFRPDDRRFIEERLAPLAAVALHNARLLQLEQKQRQESETLRKVAEIVNSTLELKEVIGSVLDQLGTVIEYDSASVQLIQGDRRILVGSRGFLVEDSPPELLLNVSEDRLISQVVESQRPVVLSDVTVEPLWDRFPATAGVNSWIGAPLVVKNQVIGLLTVDHQQAGHYTPDSGAVVAAFANQVAVAIRNANLYRDLEVLNQSAVKLAKIREAEQIYQAILDAIIETLGCDYCTLFLADPDNILVSHRSGGRLFSEAPTLRFAPGEGLAGWVYQHGEPLLVNNAAADKRYKPGPFEKKVKSRSMILSPLRRDKKIIGVISADFERPNAFDENDLRLLNTLTLYADSVLQNIDFYRDFQTIHDATNNLAKQPALADVYQTAVDSALETLHCRHSTIFILDKKTGELVAETRAGAPQDAPQVRHFKVGEGLAGYVAQTGQSVMVNNASDDERFVEGNIKPRGVPRSIVLAPIKIQDEVVGVISADKDEFDGFTEHNLEMLETLALDVGLAINLRRQLQQVSDQAQALTELNELAQRLVSIEASQDTRNLLEQVAQSAYEVLKADLIELYEYAQEGNEYRLPQISVGQRRGPMVPKDKIYQDDAVFQLIYREEPFYVERVQTESILAGPYTIERTDQPSGRFAVREGIQSTAAIPLRTGNETVGLMFASYRTPQTFAPSQREIIQLFANQAAIAIHNSRLFQEELARRQELEAISQLQQQISSVGPMEEQLQTIYDATARAMSGLMDTRNMYIALYHENTAAIEFPLVYEEGQQLSEAVKIKKRGYNSRRFGERNGLTEWVIRHKTPLLVEKAFDTWVEGQNDVEVFPFDTKCWLGAPMILHDKVIGVIGLQNFEREGVFDEHHRDLLVTIASQAAIAIENAKILEHRTAELEAISKLQQSITSISLVYEDLQTVLQTIHDATAKAMSGLMDTRNMYIALYSEDTNLIEFPLVYQKGKPIPAEQRSAGTPWGPRRYGDRNGLSEWVIRHKTPLLIERDFNTWVEAQEDVEVFSIGTKCWLGAPMLLRDKVIGVIGLQNFEREGVFDEHHRDLLVTIASQAAVAIENARLLAGEREKRLELIQQISKKMVEAGQNPDGVLEMVARAANEVSGSDLTSVYLYDQETSTFTRGVRVPRENSVEQLESDQLPKQEDFAAQVAETQEPTFIDDVEENPEASAFAVRHQLQAFAALPLTIAGLEGLRTTVGVLFVNFKQTHAFSDDEREILLHLANQAAVAIAYAGAQVSALAKEQLAALGTAAATLQHRLGNTINVILPAVERLRYRIADDSTNNDILHTIERNALFATEVLRRMQTPLRQEPFVRTHFNSLLRDAIQKCVQDTDRFPNIPLIINSSERKLEPSSIAQPQIIITADLDEQLPETFASVGQMTEVFRVLVENAIKAIYPQAGFVTITSKLNRNGLRQFVEITVTDTGKGIDEKVRAKLFTQPVPRKEFGEGAGLGLWLSHIIVRSHQGSLRLQATELNKGSTFWIRLPVLTQPLPSYTAQRGEGL